MKPNIGVLISGRGSNLMAIKEAIDRGDLNARIGFVGSDVPDCPGMVWASGQGLDTVFLDYSKGREAAECQIDRAMELHRVRHLVLAGFMRILSAPFVGRHRGQVINLHPSLLPSFPGQSGIRDAFLYGVRITGVTVHLVDEQVDHGPILAQEAVEILEGDTLESLEERVHRVEHRLYPATIDRWLKEGDFSLASLRLRPW